MRSALAAIVGCAAAVGAVSASEIEDVLLQRFADRNRVAMERLRIEVNEAVAKAKAMKESDAEGAMALLRNVGGRVDRTPILAYAERKAMNEAVRLVLTELRDHAAAIRREAATTQFEAFRAYLETGAQDAKGIGRANPEKWEPAIFTDLNGVARPVKFTGLGTGVISHHYRSEEKNYPPGLFPWVQVFGGMYVFDKSVNHHVFLTNREFFEHVWMPIVPELRALDLIPEAGWHSRYESGRKKRLEDPDLATGVMLLRQIPSAAPIPGVEGREAEFVEFAAVRLRDRGLPLLPERIYDPELERTMFGASAMHKSAIRRSLNLMQARNLVVSPLYAEILREEASVLVRSEYANFPDVELNRALPYVFRQLR